MGLFRTADLIRRRIMRLIDAYGVTQQQYNVLRILRGAGENGLPTLVIGDRMIEQAPGVTRLIDHLEKARLVTRKPCSEDRRRVLCRITPAGLEILEKLDEPLKQAVVRNLDMLSEAETLLLIELLDRIRGGSRPASGESSEETKR